MRIQRSENHVWPCSNKVRVLVIISLIWCTCLVLTNIVYNIYIYAYILHDHYLSCYTYTVIMKTYYMDNKIIYIYNHRFICNICVWFSLNIYITVFPWSQNGFYTYVYWMVIGTNWTPQRRGGMKRRWKSFRCQWRCSSRGFHGYISSS